MPTQPVGRTAGPRDAVRAVATASGPLEIGSPAPAFRLPSTEDREIALGDYRGEKSVVLVFYPLDFSPVCSLAVPDYSSRRERFEARGAVVLGISRDSLHTHKAWAREFGIGLPLLSDMAGVAATAYGIEIPERRVNERAVFVVDRDGVLRYQHVEGSTGDVTVRAEDVLAVLDELATR